jgi:hypothetical protein
VRKQSEENSKKGQILKYSRFKKAPKNDKLEGL